jgi:hypothetical protein
VKLVVETTGLPRNRIYRLALALTADQDTEPEQDG